MKNVKEHPNENIPSDADSFNNNEKNSFELKERLKKRYANKTTEEIKGFSLKCMLPRENNASVNSFFSGVGITSETGIIKNEMNQEEKKNIEIMNSFKKKNIESNQKTDVDAEINEKPYNEECKKIQKFNFYMDKQNAINSIISSTVAGIISRTVTAPLDRIKYIMQVTNNLSIYEVFEMIKKDGVILGFFRGNCVNVIKIIPELSIKMYSYEFMKLNVYQYYQKKGKYSKEKKEKDEKEGEEETIVSKQQPKTKEDHIEDSIDDNIDIPFFIRFFMGSSSGLLASIFIYPLEIIKTRLIVSNKKDENNLSGIFKCIYHIYKHENCRNFYNGLCMNMYGVVFFSGCNMSIYDYLKYLFFNYYKTYIHENYCQKGNFQNNVKNNLQESTKEKCSLTNTTNPHHDSSNIINELNSTEERKEENTNVDKTNLLNPDVKLQSIHTNYNTLKNFEKTKYNSLYQWDHSKRHNLNELNENKKCTYCDYRMKNVNCLVFLFFGITSSFIAQLVSYPFLVLRTRMQTLNNEITTKYLNTERKKIKTCNFILYNIKMYGFRSLYRGIYVNLLKTIPATSITWFSYEFTMRKLQNR